MLKVKQIDLAGKWSQLVATSRREADFLQINESQSIWQWPATEIEPQIKMNELPPKPIYDSLPEGAKIQIVSLCHGNDLLSGSFPENTAAVKPFTGIPGSHLEIDCAVN